MLPTVVPVININVSDRKVRAVTVFDFFDLLTSPELLDKVNALLPDQSFGARDWNSGQVATARVCPVWAGVSCRFHILESPLEWTNDSC